MNQILELGQDVDKFHPLAVKHYQEFLDDISKDVPLGNITENDVKEFLSEFDYYNYQHSIKRLSEWLDKCLLSNDSSTLKVYPDSFPVWGTWGFKGLLLKVYQEKRRRKELKEAQADAQFQSYLDLMRRNREREEARAQHENFIDKIVHSTDSFKVRLSKQKEPGFNNYPGWLQPYKPSLWCELPFPPKDWFSVELLVKIACEKSLLFEACRDHVNHKVTFLAWYVPSSVTYEVIAPPPSPHSKGHPSKPGTGVPCLRWQMATYILSTAEFWLDNGIIVDERYDDRWESRCKPENLGKLYGGPEFWKCQDAFTTPLSLLALLAWGKPEQPGVEVVRRDAPWTTYKILGYLDEISLHDDFRRFIHDMVKNTSLDKALLDRGMCDTETSLLIKQKMDKLKEPEAPAAVPQKSVEPGIETGDDFSDMVTALAGLGYAKVEALPAAKHVCQKFPDETLEKKMTLALQYISQ
jgi:hypothetical protein